MYISIKSSQAHHICFGSAPFISLSLLAGMDLVISTCILILSFAVHSNADGGTNGYLNFVTHHVYVPEKQYEVATFNLRREGGSSGLIFFYCKVSMKQQNIITVYLVMLEESEKWHVI